MDSTPRPADAIVLAALLLLSLAIRIPYLFTERLWPDEALYATIARDFVASPASLLRVDPLAEHLPLLPVLLSPGLVLANDLAGLRVMTLLINLLGIVATWRLGVRVAGPFVGLCAALFMALNAGYLHHSHLILIDGAYAVAHVGLALALLNVRAGPGWDRHDLWVGLAATGVALLKWYGVLMVGPIVAIYYLIASRELPLVQRLRKLLLPALCLAIGVGPYLAARLAYLGEQGGVVSYFHRPAAYYLLTAPRFVGGPLALCLVLAGGIFLPRRPPGVRALIAASILVVFAVMSLAPERDGRYLLPALPFLAVLYGLGVAGLIETLARTRARHGAARAVALGALSLQFIPLAMDKDRTPINRTYTGFMEAGETVRALATPDAMILAGSVRAMRLAAGRERAPNVRPLPPTPEALRATLRSHPGRVVLETDRWEFTQPGWLFPWSDARIESLEATGLRRAALVRRVVEGQNVPVVLVLTRDPLAR
jgi:4-amino-4-deoxy-L-arabinose transferase-like glycosyltransferase